MPKNVTTRLRELRIAKGLTSAELARASGILPPTLSKLELGQRGLSGHNAKHLAAALGVTAPDLYAEIGSPLPMRSSEAVPAEENEAQGARYRPIAHSALHYGLPMDIPVYGTAAGSAGNGSFLIAPGEIVDMAARGPGIQHLKNVYALYVEGVSMEPWKRPGQLVYIDPIRKPRKGDRIVIVTRPNNSCYDQAYLKEFIKSDDNEIVVKQYNPEKIIKWDIDKVISAHRVLEPEEML